MWVWLALVDSVSATLYGFAGMAIDGSLRKLFSGCIFHWYDGRRLKHKFHEMGLINSSISLLTFSVIQTRPNSDTAPVSSAYSGTTRDRNPWSNNRRFSHSARARFPSRESSHLARLISTISRSRDNPPDSNMKRLITAGSRLRSCFSLCFRIHHCNT